MPLRTIDSLGSLAGKKVIVRCDLNVPLKDGQITDDGRIRASLPTLNSLIQAGARVIVISHLGRPDGAPDARYTLAPVAQRLSELLGKAVTFASDTVGAAAKDAVGELVDGDVALLENLRFNPGETAKSDDERKAFATRLAELGDLFVSDGFGVVHRKQASVYELAQLLPSAAGTLIATELAVLDRLTETPTRPYAVVLGGSKVSDKLGVIAHLLPRVDSLLIGGGMLFTFLAAQGHTVGSSLLETDQLDVVRGYLATAAELGVRIVLPTDVVVASKFGADAEHQVRAADDIEGSPWGKAGLGLDIGPETAERFASVIRSSSTVFWNGPMGVFELAPFAAGTKTVAQALTEVDGLSVVGGGDSAAAVRALGFTDDQFGHISTGGGASLEFLEGKSLPGLEVLGWSQTMLDPTMRGITP
jgi:phosphoglycerate kinase